MAQAPLSVDPVQFSCSICLELLRDPVTVPCGHSYCMKCLTAHWDHQLTYSCPQCRATFSPRPTLGRNTLLAEMLSKLGSVSLSAAVPSAPPLHDDHGFVHAAFDISSVRPERNDAERLVGETRRHLSQQIKDKELELQQLKQSLHSLSRLAKGAVKDCSKIFSELLEFLERRRVETKELIRAHEKAEVTRAENHIQHLEQQIAELRRRDAELETTHLTQDQRLITQMCQSHCGSDSAGAAVPVTTSPHVSFGPVRKAVADLKEQIQSLYQREFMSVTSAVKSVNVLQVEKANKEPAVSSHVPALDNRDDLFQYFCSVSLDPFTAHNELTLTEGNRVVSRTGDLHTYPDHPDRFDTWCQILCREEIAGRGYWEAEWTGREVAVGLTYETISRKGSSNNCRLGYNSSSWSLRCTSSSFTFSHGNEAVTLPSPPASRRIGVFVDHDMGLLCFYTVASPGPYESTRIQLLHRVTTRFKQPLYPAAWLGAQSSVTFCSVD